MEVDWRPLFPALQDQMHRVNRIRGTLGKQVRDCCTPRPCQRWTYRRMISTWVLIEPCRNRLTMMLLKVKTNGSLLRSPAARFCRTLVSLAVIFQQTGHFAISPDTPARKSGVTWTTASIVLWRSTMVCSRLATVCGSGLGSETNGRLSIDW